MKNFINNMKKWFTVKVSKKPIPSADLKNKGEIKMITQYLNDPTTPELKHTGEPKSQVDNFNLNIVGYAEPGKPVGSNEWLPENCYGNLVGLLNNIKPHISGKKWAAVQKLGVLPRAGEMMNAYYDRANLKFFYFTHNNRHVETSSSADIICHELGHAILDAIRPDFWNLGSLEIPAFHEAFGDIMALHAALFYDEVLNVTNLDKSTFLSKVGEDFGMAIGSSVGLRDMNNSLRYSNPVKLPSKPADGILSNECHDFSRVWSGCYFYILKGMVQKNGGTKEGLIKARDYLLKIFMEAVKICPATTNFYENLAKCMINTDSKYGGTYKTMLNSYFVERQILKMEIKMLSANNTEEEIKVDKNEVFVNLQSLKLKSVLSQSLSDVRIRVPADKFIIDGEVQSMSIDNEALDHTSAFVDSLIENKEIGKSWMITKDNVLERAHVSCPCC